MCCEGSLSTVSQDCRCTRLNTLELWARLSPFNDLPNALGDPHAFFSSSFQPFCSFLPRCLEQYYTRLNHELTHKTQFSHAKIKCALKDSSCDTPLSKNLRLTILVSNFRNQTQRSHSQRRTERMLSPIGLPVFLNRQLFQLTQDKKSTASRNFSTTCQLLLFNADLNFSFRAQHTGTLGEVKAIRQLAKFIRRSSGLPFCHFLCLFSRFVPFCQVVSMPCLKLQIPET
ncbi:hypothetical protein H5410_014864 [Solanum commersonii]|uniref:Uncharacterized protein n=1 Tax=Solanum commersonii TaxID=4109 RepID=A0A9J5ZS87_SOLCO|nr:hypothetical protein H5410_014864 [Solanum commersonii]